MVNIADLKSAAEKLTGSNPVRRTSASAQHLLSSGFKNPTALAIKPNNLFVANKRSS